jgi:hypothetical protein
MCDRKIKQKWVVIDWEMVIRVSRLGYEIRPQNMIKEGALKKVVLKEVRLISLAFPRK